MTEVLRFGSVLIEAAKWSGNDCVSTESILIATLGQVKLPPEILDRVIFASLDVFGSRRRSGNTFQGFTYAAQDFLNSIGNPSSPSVLWSELCRHKPGIAGVALTRAGL